MSSQRKAILLYGPTAAGKTGVSLHLAKAFGGEIINADSRQIYREMPVITAMPSADEQAQALHHLFDFLPPTENFSVGRWLTLAKEKAEEIWARGGVPIFVGGTGFYLKVLREGISPMPETDSEILNSYQARLEREGSERLYRELCDVDFAWAKKTSPEDSHRLLRGLSVHKQTGIPLSQWQQEPLSGALEADFLALAISPARGVLNERIHRRYGMMIEEGVMEEARHLYDKYLKNMNPDEVPPPALKSIGLMDYAAFFAGEISEKEAHERVQRQMRQYAKRQRTWLRNSYGADSVFASGAETENIISKACQFVG